METKVCTGCKIGKPLEAFSLHPGGKFGRNPKCRECKDSQARDHYGINKERLNKEKTERRRNDRWFPRYGLTKERYLEICAEQSGRCLICKEVPVKLVVDHDHETGIYRGLLCSNCNSGIGLLRENEEALARASQYVKFYRDHPNQAVDGSLSSRTSRKTAGFPEPEALLEMLATSNFKAVGLRFGVSGVAVASYLKKNGVWTPVLPRIDWPGDEELLKAVETEGKHEVARLLGASESSVVKRVRRIKTSRHPC